MVVSIVAPPLWPVGFVASRSRGLRSVAMAEPAPARTRHYGQNDIGLFIVDFALSTFIEN